MGRDDFDGLDAETRDPQVVRSPKPAKKVLSLTILHHQEIDRVGEIALLEGAGPFSLSRSEPLFGPFHGKPARPLADPFVSRSPISLARAGDGRVTLRRGDATSAVNVEGAELEAEMILGAEQIERGAVVELASTTLLVLRAIDPPGRPVPALGLVGESDGIRSLRSDVLRVARSELPVLLRGETGTGKEQVARALHEHGLSAGGPFVAANMAAIQPALAVSALFGHTKGAFTGADSDRVGLFERADGGTLFLDEIGEAPPEVQVMLLRVLETGRLEPVGGDQERSVSVRLIAATDADLDSLQREGRFRPALLHRLSGFEIRLPPLRNRREDLGRLAVHFHRDSGEGEPLPAPVVARLARFDWPGNVRQLANVVRSLALYDPSDAAGMMARLDAVLGEPAAEQAAPPSVRRPSELTGDAIFEAMKSEQWRLERAAERLGISRATLYRRIEEHPELRTAKDLSREDLERAVSETGGDLARMSDLLRVSVSGIRQRMKELGLGPKG